MNTFKKFDFDRKKGIVWVCDVIKSSMYLNSEESVDDIENYLPRLYWTTNNLVNAFGGKFIKWTGDGFLAWFEVDLDRNKQNIANKVYKAAWHLTFLNNVTQLGLKPKSKFGIRHGITYEKNGLLFKIHEENGNQSLDLIGRSVVLAFRLSGIQSKFPSIVTEKEITPNKASIIYFDNWNPNEEDILKFFKGEKLGIEDIMISSDKTVKEIASSTNNIVSKSEKLINEIENNISTDTEIENCIQTFIKLMQNGPEWCEEVIKIELEFTKKMFGTIKEINSFLKKH